MIQVKLARRFGLAIAVFAAILLAFVFLRKEDLVLAERGLPAKTAIELPASPSASQRFAAEELRTYILRQTGVELPITEGASADTAIRKIRIESWTEDGEDAFRIRTEGRDLVIGGGCRGVLYGVYEVLSRFGGVRWYSSWCEKVPELAMFSVPRGYSDRQKPAFRYRMTTWYDVLHGGEDKSWNFAARCRINGVPNLSARQGGVAYRFGNGLGNCHTFAALLPTAKYGKEHPEYYALVNGVRKCAPGSDHGTQPCLSNPDVLRVVTANVLERIRKDPAAGYYGVSQNDNQNYCRCSACRKIDEEEGSHSGTVIRFVNAVAKAVEKEFPEAVVETLAYRYSRRPPRLVRPRDNVMVCLCTIECDFSRPIPESDFAENILFQEDLSGWRDIAKRVYVWDYTVNFRHYLNQFPNFAALQGNLGFFRRNGVTDVFEQGDGQGRRAYFAEWKTYLLSKLMWNPDADVRALEEDFFNGYYGKAGPFVLRYYRETVRREREEAAQGGHALGIYERVQGKPFDAAFYDWAESLWAKAEAAVADGPDVVRSNVFYSSLFLDYARVMADCQTVWLDGRGLRLPPERLAACARRLLRAMDGDRTIRLSENAGNNAQILDVVRKVAAGHVPRPSAPGQVEESCLILSRTPNLAEYVDDPLAEDGRAIRFFNTHHAWTSSLQTEDVDFVPGENYRVRLRVRVEKKPDVTEGSAFWAGVYDMASGRELLHLEPTVESVREPGYVWYDLGVFAPDREQYFWIGPPPFGKDGKSPVKAVFLDKLEFVRMGRREQWEN